MPVGATTMKKEIQTEYDLKMESIQATAGLDKKQWAPLDKRVDINLDPGPGKVIFVGDLDSNEKGSGARANADKLAVEQLPVRVWYKIFASRAAKAGRNPGMWALLEVIEDLAEFQEGIAGGAQLLSHVPPRWIDDAIDVFVFYGNGKYKQPVPTVPGNWLKGMPWSVPTASAIRHARAMFDGEQNDQESGFSHAGHLVCNLIMLATFERSYKAGNDYRDPKFFME